MGSQRIAPGLLMTTTAAGVAVLLTACGQTSPRAQTTITTTMPAVSTGPHTEPAPTPSAATAPTETAPPPGKVTAAPAPETPPVPTVPALCKAAELSAATDASGGGAVGSVYMKLNLTNNGSEPCMLSGFPGVSFNAGAAGAPIGAPAVRDGSASVVDVVLAPGQTGSVALRYTHAGNYPGCAMANAAGLRIYPPEDTASLFLPQPTKACSNSDSKLPAIGPFQPQ